MPTASLAQKNRVRRRDLGMHSGGTISNELLQTLPETFGPIQIPGITNFKCNPVVLRRKAQLTEDFWPLVADEFPTYGQLEVSPTREIIFVSP